jgi:hypothetical protein
VIGNRQFHIAVFDAAGELVDQGAWLHLAGADCGKLQ